MPQETLEMLAKTPLIDLDHSDEAFAKSTQDAGAAAETET